MLLPPLEVPIIYMLSLKKTEEPGQKQLKILEALLLK
jgi:hypothetical protein